MYNGPSDSGELSDLQSCRCLKSRHVCTRYTPGIPHRIIYLWTVLLNIVQLSDNELFGVVLDCVQGHSLKGQSNEIFASDYFTNRFLLSLLLCIWRLFEFGFEFGEIFAIFYWLSAIVYSGELILPVLFTTESCDSSYCSQRGVKNVWIFCRNSAI